MPRQLARRRSSASLDDHAGDTEDFSDEAAQGGETRRRRTRARSEEEPAPRTSRRPSSREAPAPRSRGRGRDSAPASSTRVGKGWGGVRKHKEESSSYASNFRVTDEEVLVKFLDEEPFITFYQHWLNELDGKKSFTCLGDDCPLCEIGDDPRFLACFNVVDMRDEPEVKVWEASPQPAGEIEELAKNSRFSPVNRDDLYFAVSRKKGKNGFWSYTLVPVKDRDLPDDWDIDPLDEGELDALAANMYDDSILRVTSREDLLDVVEELDA